MQHCVEWFVNEILEGETCLKHQFKIEFAVVPTTTKILVMKVDVGLMENFFERVSKLSLSFKR